jgi:hypothetical protein
MKSGLAASMSRPISEVTYAQQRHMSPGRTSEALESLALLLGFWCCWMVAIPGF